MLRMGCCKIRHLLRRRPEKRLGARMVFMLGGEDPEEVYRLAIARIGLQLGEAEVVGFPVSAARK